MYSLVLMAAVAAGPNTPALGHGGGCWGCNGCTGAYAGCTGYASCHGCYGSSCHGSCHGRGFLGHRSGCCGGGGLFGHHKRSCHGCSGCHGSCYGSGYGSCYGSGCVGSCYGCFGGYAYPAYPIPPAVVVPPAGGMSQPMPETKPQTKPADKKKGTEGDNGASLKFRLPADAVLYVDGRQTPAQGTERSFTTPPLAAGQKFFYDVRAEIAVNGITVVEEKRVVVEAGADVSESFPKLFAAVESGATVAGK